MIYTSYFGNLKKLQSGTIPITPIAICGKSPDWYTGLEYKKLAPKKEFFKVWQQTRDNDYYIQCFNEQVLSKLDPVKVSIELERMMCLPGTNPCLLCYEKPSEFCHRHLVAKWFQEANIRCQEIVISYSMPHQKKREYTNSCEAMYMDVD